MKTALQVLFGVALGVAGIVTFFWLGLLVNGQPGWRTGIMAVLLLAATQVVSFFVFRRRIALQVLSGLVLCAGVAAWLIYSSRSFFWETRYPDGSNPITWRSDLVLLLLLAITQGISFLVFHRIRLSGPRPPAGPTVSRLHG
jgi:hypothetical protein